MTIFIKSNIKKSKLIEVKKDIFYHTGFDTFFKRVPSGKGDIADYYALKNDKNLRKEHGIAKDPLFKGDYANPQPKKYWK